MQINEAKVIWIGIGLWAAAFVILLPFRKNLIADGHGWWLYTCLAGAGLGMVGLPMVGRRKAVMDRETERGRQIGHDEGAGGGGGGGGRERKGRSRDKGRDGRRDGGRDNGGRDNAGRDNGRGRGRR